MLKYLTVEESIELLKEGNKIILVDDDSLENECHYVAIAKPVLDEKLLSHFCPYQTGPTIVLGYEKYGQVTGVKKNINFEYDEDFVNLGVESKRSKDTIDGFISALLNANASIDDFRIGGQYQVVSTRQGGVLKRAVMENPLLPIT
jgi:3,4-dihydroxy-2-butanone 4-phosphate synthase